MLREVEGGSACEDAGMSDAAPLLEVSDLVKHFPTASRPAADRGVEPA